MIRDWFSHGTSPTRQPVGRSSWPTTTRGRQRPMHDHAHPGRPDPARRTPRPRRRPRSTPARTGGTPRRSTARRAEYQQAVRTRRGRQAARRAERASLPTDPGATTRPREPGFWLGLVHAADAVHPRAQRRSATRSRAALPGVGRRGALPAGPADHRRADRQDPHRRVDAGRHQPPDDGHRAAGQLVGPGRRAAAAGCSAGSATARSSAASPASRRTDHYGVPYSPHRGVRRRLPDAPADPRRLVSCARPPTTTRLRDATARFGS